IMGTFTTLCSAASTPFSESFSGSLPGCWTNTNNTNSTSTYLKWLFSGGMGYGTTGNGGRAAGTFAWVDASSPYALGASVILTTVPIDLTGVTAPLIESDCFKHHLTSASGTRPANYENARLSVDVNSGSGWSTVFSDTSNSPDWRLVR